MLIGWVPEEGRSPALRRFTESVDWIARNLEQGKRFRLGVVLLPLETSRIGLVCDGSLVVQGASLELRTG
jgi:hypothetical protein